MIKKSYDKISETLFIPYPIIVKTLQQSSLFFYFFNDFQSSKNPAWSGLESDLLWKTHQLWVILSNLQQDWRTHWLHTKVSITLMKKFSEMLLVLIFMLLKLAMVLIFTANNLWSFIFAIAFVCIFTCLKELGP